MKSTIVEIDEKTEEALLKCIQQFSWKPDEELVNHFRRALRARFEGIVPEEIQNTYLKEFEIPQIRLFDILANRFPLVLEAQKLVENCIMELAKNQQQLCIVDLGIGRSVQMARVLNSLNACKSLETVTLIGIEIQKESLEYSKNLIEDLKESLNFTLHFYPINRAIEEIAFDELRQLIPSGNCKLVVNASLALHHVQSIETRTRILSNFASLNPDLLTLIEPNVNCFTNDFEERCMNAYEHFGALYAYINTLELKEEEKKGLKQFFSNELFDAIALPDQYRFEKYDLSQHWADLGKSFGLSNFNIKQFIQSTTITGIKVSYNESGFVNFGFGETDILGIIALKSADTPK
jgi:hypothetical protein